MNAAVKIVGKHAAGKVKRNPNADNPYMEWVEVWKNGKCKRKKQERPIPAGLSANDGKILRNIRKKAYHYDQSFTCCCFGFRFGWSAIIGLIPLIGDVIEVLMSLSLIRSASKLDGGLPKRLYSMMVTNIVIDFAAGFVPILGDIVDALYRANTRNAWLLDAYLTEKAAMQNPGLVQVVGGGGVGEKGSGRQQTMRAVDRDVEQGLDPMGGVGQGPMTPAVLPPARTPAPRANMAPVPPRPGPPGRNLTGRQMRDPRDHR